MKRILAVLTLLCFVGLSVSEASFPVKKQDQSQTSSQELVENVDSQSLTLPSEEQLSEMAAVPDAGDRGGWSDEDWILLALWFFLGGVAGHRWYARKNVWWNILFILTLGGCYIWAIVDLVKILQRDFM